MAKKRESPLYPPGGDKTLKLAALEAGAKILQESTPLKEFDIYVVGFHCAKHMPEMQMEAHHFCKQVNQDFLQCVIFDGNTDDANLIGVEYIISEKLFEQLPAEEHQYWHPHNYEILSGTLVAPGIPAVAEKAMLKLLMNSYGKTWHFWHTGRHDGKGEPGHPLPMGDAFLVWSFNRDGELDSSLLDDMNKEMEIDSSEKREHRQDLVEVAHPQRGVDALKGKFPNAAETPPPGIVEKETT